MTMNCLPSAAAVDDGHKYDDRTKMEFVGDNASPGEYYKRGCLEW